MVHEKAFCLWSGGKDSCLALHRAFRQGIGIRRLITILREDGFGSRSHGLSRKNLHKQAKSLGMEMRFAPAKRGGYCEVFDKLIDDAMRCGYKTGVFGDIYVEEHRAWIEERALRLGFTPLFPLWGADTLQLCHELLEAGSMALIVAARKGVLEPEWLGKTLDNDVIDGLLKMGIDPCGENGEYHTFVYGGPVFDTEMAISRGKIWESGNYFFLEITT
jgi:uncharacterized protein (TIGR00290 family)